MNRIKFSHNWNNKLNQDIFTTIRKYTYDKWVYYKSLENKIFIVILNGSLQCDAELISIESMRLNEVPRGLICSDTGMIPEDAFKLFRKFRINKHETVIILTFKHTKQYEDEIDSDEHEDWGNRD